MNIKKRDYKENFFKNDCDLENCFINGERVSCIRFLHGFCDDFAIVLAEKFNYRLILWIDYDWDIDKDVLVHAFNVCTVDGKTYYIDVRGITDDLDEIMSDFPHFEEPRLTSPLDIEEAMEVLEALNVPRSNRDLQKDILNIIESLDIYNVSKQNGCVS
ncbi:MAG: hypothetical protein ACOCQR_02300 [bacterium]